MIRVTTANSVYLYDRRHATIVALAGSHEGWVNRNMKLENVAAGRKMRSVPSGSDYFLSTPVLEIVQVEDDLSNICECITCNNFN